MFENNTVFRLSDMTQEVVEESWIILKNGVLKETVDKILKVVCFVKKMRLLILFIILKS